MIILDMLDCVDLTKLATITPRLQQLIVSRYLIPKCRLHEREILVLAGNDAAMHCDDFYSGKPYANTYSEVLSILQSLGHIFKNLDLRIYPTKKSSEYWDKLAFVLNKYCSNAYQKIEYSKDD